MPTAVVASKKKIPAEAEKLKQEVAKKPKYVLKTDLKPTRKIAKAKAKAAQKRPMWFEAEAVIPKAISEAAAFATDATAAGAGADSGSSSTSGSSSGSTSEESGGDESSASEDDDEDMVVEEPFIAAAPLDFSKYDSGTDSEADNSEGMCNHLNYP